MVDYRVLVGIVVSMVFVTGLATTSGAQIARPPDNSGVASGPANPGPANPGPANPGPVNPGPVTPGPVTPGPVTPPPIAGPGGPPPIPPGPGTQPEKQLSYYVVINGQQAGPFDNAGLKAKVASGELVRTSLVWTEGMPNWEEAAKVPDLVQILASVPPPVQFDAVAFMAGSWQSDPERIQIPNIGPATAYAQAQYNRDGTYSYLGRIEAMVQGMPATQMITSEGTFTAKEQGKGKILITPNGQITVSMAGQVPRTDTNNTPFVLTIIDDNTVANDSGLRSYRVSR